MLTRRFAGAIALALIVANGAAVAAAKDYRFEASGTPQRAADGKSVVLVRLSRIADGKPVPGAVIVQTRADMGPMSMGEMTAPVKALGEAEPGVYRFEVQPGMTGKWALTLTARVQGETEPVRGNVIVELRQ